jgi:uncharacterized membrane protein YdfJ with MMPL/SSD domain
MEQEKQETPEIYFPEMKEEKSNKKFLIIIGVILLILLGVILFTKLPSEKKAEPTDFIKKQVDSLAKANAELQSKHQALDSANKTYQDQIYDLDWKIDNVENNKTIIKEYYRDVSRKPSRYTPKQVDSFFKKRYKY